MLLGISPELIFFGTVSTFVRPTLKKCGTVQNTQSWQAQTPTKLETVQNINKIPRGLGLVKSSRLCRNVFSLCFFGQSRVFLGPGLARFAFFGTISQFVKADPKKTRDCPKTNRKPTLGVLNRQELKTLQDFFSCLRQFRVFLGSGLARIDFFGRLAFCEADPKKVWNCARKKTNPGKPRPQEAHWDNKKKQKTLRSAKKYGFVEHTTSRRSLSVHELT